MTATCTIELCPNLVASDGAMCVKCRPSPGLYWARLRDGWTVIEVHPNGSSDSIGWDGGAYPREIGAPVVRGETSDSIAGAIAGILRSRIGRVDTFATIAARQGLNSLADDADDIAVEVAAAIGLTPAVLRGLSGFAVCAEIEGQDRDDDSKSAIAWLNTYADYEPGDA